MFKNSLKKKQIHTPNPPKNNNNNNKNPTQKNNLLKTTTLWGGCMQVNKTSSIPHVSH